MSSNRFKIIAAMADLHIGLKRVSADSLKDQLKKHFFKPLNEIYQLDAVLILGDILHTIISLNTEYSELFNWFISKLYRLGQKRKCPIVIVKGTLSHDNDQLNNIKHYQYNDDGVDFRVYESIQEIELFKDFKVLVLPDVRVKDTKEIDKLFEKKYDMIIGHGLVDAMKFFVQESESSPAKVYVFDSDKLIECSRGPILFGHIHQFQHIRHKFYYVGPFTLLERGGHDAGFAIVGIDSKHHDKFRVEHYINPDSARYYDIDVSKDILVEATAQELIEAIDNIIADAKEHDLITLRITRDEQLESSEKVLMLESRYRSDKRISIVKKIKTKKDEEREKRDAERISRYSYILDTSTDGDPNQKMAEIMYRYYTEDIKPKFKDQSCEEANIPIDEFIDVFKS